MRSFIVFWGFVGFLVIIFCDKYRKDRVLPSENAHILFGELRPGLWMYGVFALRTIPPNAPIAPWGGTAVRVNATLTDQLHMLNHVKNYAVLGKHDTDGILIGPRFFECNESVVMDDPGVLMALSNEPSPDVMVRWDRRTQSMRRTPRRRGVVANNLCLVLPPDRYSGVFYTTRWVREGEELTWCYGNSYKRTYDVGICSCDGVQSTKHLDFVDVVLQPFSADAFVRRC
jgi:hypothetical protein